MVTASLLIDGTGAPPLPAAGVLVEDGVITIVASAPEIRDVAARSAIPITDTEPHGTTLIPGLVDGHVHIGWGYPGIDAWEADAPPERRLFYMAHAARLAVAAGITTIRDCGCAGFDTLHARDAIRDGLIPGPRIVACGPCITTTGGHGEFIGVTADTTDDLRRRVRELAAAGVDAIKVMATGGSMDPQTNPRRAQYTADELRPAVDDAHRLGLRVIAHCNATEGIGNAVAAGVDTIAHCNWLGPEPGTIDYQADVARAMLDQGTSIDLNIAATIRPLADGDGHAERWDNARPGNRWELHRELRDGGAPIFFTSDEFGPNVDRFPSLLVRAVRELDIDVAEAIHRATLVPATALALADRIGAVTVGRRADLVLLDGRADLDPAALLRPIRVWQDGRRSDVSQSRGITTSHDPAADAQLNNNRKTQGAA